MGKRRRAISGTVASSRSLLLVCLLALALPGAVFAQTPSIVPGTEQAFGDHHYVLLTPSSWPNADGFARSLEVNLVVINDEVENEWVCDTYSANGTRFLWIGFFQDPSEGEPDGGWQWVDGSPVTYTAWDAGEPNNQGGDENYAHMFWRETLNATVWNDAPDDYWGTCYGVIEYTPTFYDVPLDYWARDDILACVDAGVVTGFPEGDYKPDRYVSRAQMSVFVARGLAGGEENVPEPTTDPGFIDVDSEHWAYKYICYAVDQNVVTGYPEGDYKPDQWVSRDQMAVYMARAMVAPTTSALDSYVPADPRNFPDVPTDHWAYTYVEFCVEQGIVSGFPEGDYRPERIVTRDQMAVYVSRAFGLT